MLNITDEHKALYWADSTHKIITISSMDNSFEDITNDRIHSESLSITEILCDEDNIKFGKCGGSEISITVSGVDDSITGKEILIEISIDNNTLPLGIFKIDKPSMSVNRGYKALHGYDRMNRLDVDVSEWYSALYTNAETYTVKQLRDSLFTHLDLEQEEITLINDDVVVSETLDATNGISARKIIEDICEINGVFGRFDRYGVFTYVTLFRNLIYPSNNLYPSPSIYPGMELDPLHNELTEFKSCSYEEYTMYPIDSLYVSYDDVAVKIGTTDTSTYSITDNFIVIGQGENQLTSIARGLYTKIHGIKLRPNETDVRGLPYFEVGDYYTVDNGEDIIQSYIFKRTLSGIQALSDSFSAKGDEYLVRDTTSNNAQIVSKVASYTKRQLSNYDLQVQNMTTVITQAFGLYRVEVPQANGSTKFYMCDAPTLEESTNVWQFTAGGIMQSTDGGTTWGIDNNGNALFNSVVAHKITADWIKTGTLEAIAINNGNGTFLVDADGNCTTNSLRASNIIINNGLFTCDTLGNIVANSLKSTNALITGGSFNVTTSEKEKSIIEFKSGSNYKTAITPSDITSNNIYAVNPNSPNSEITLVSNGGIAIGDTTTIVPYSIHIYKTGVGVAQFGVNGMSTPGTKSRIVKTDNYNDRLLYCYETPTPMFGDIGEATIDENGECYIFIDDIFKETINSRIAYNVFLTKYNEGDVFVYERTTNFFVVKGTPNIKFVWEIKAKQKGYDDLRMENGNNLFKEEQINYEQEFIDYVNSITEVNYE